MGRTYLDTAKVDVTFNAWWKEYGNKQETIERALARTRQQIGPPMDPAYVPPPLRKAVDTSTSGPAKKPLTVERVTLMSDDFGKRLGWDDVIGPDMGSGASKINIEIEAVGDIEKIPVTVTSRLPNKIPGAGTIPAPLKWDVPRSNVTAPTPGRSLFRLTKLIGEAGPFLGRTGVNDVATIVRDGGTSDAEFRANLGTSWTVRGIGTQPKTSGSTGDESKEIPDGFALLKAAGVEVLEVSIAADPGWVITAGKATRLIRKPCKIVYYSGHGWSFGNYLAIEIIPHVQYDPWARPSDLVGVWTKTDCANLELFVIAGCSLLKYEPGVFATARDKTGLAWAELLTGKKGPLVSLLGYADAAPLDSAGGDIVARLMATKLAGGSTDYVRAWLEVNGTNRAWNASGMDSKGYWWLDPERDYTDWGHRKPFAFSNIKGPRAIP
jgi:hypothetical protein